MTIQSGLNNFSNDNTLLIKFLVNGIQTCKNFVGSEEYFSNDDESINFVFLSLDKSFVKHYVGYTYRAIGLTPMLSIGGQLLVVVRHTCNARLRVMSQN